MGISNYFSLQYKLLNRNLIAFGLPTIIAYFLVPVLFYFVSTFLLSKISYFEYFLFAAPVVLVSFLSSENKNNFLFLICKRSDYYTIRLIENIIVSFPFVTLLVYNQFFVLSICLLSVVLVLSFFKFDFQIYFKLPTFFSKNPFEFIEGFRKTFLIIVLLYFLTAMSIIANNLNLGLVVVLLMLLVSASYFNTLEDSLFVWNFRMSAKEFLWYKFLMSLRQFAVLSGPVVIALGIFFIRKIEVIVTVFLVCCVYLSLAVFSKYASFPRQINLSQSMLFVLCLLFPPALLFVVPITYLKSEKLLKIVLND